MKYRILNQKNPEYHGDRIRKLNYLYQGGHEVKEHANLFIPQELFESYQGYQHRLKCASYINYLSQIINDYSSELFSKQLTVLPKENTDGDPDTFVNVDPVYNEFSENADMQGHSFLSVLENAFVESLISGRSFIGIDFPSQPSEFPIQNALQEEQLGLTRPYLYKIPTLTVIDWEHDEFGNFEFLVLKSETCKRLSPTGERDKKTIRFKLWKKDPETKVVSWELYEITVDKLDKIDEEDEIPLVNKGVTTFPEIPVVCISPPDNLYIGNLIGDLCAEHFNRASSLEYATRRSLFAVAVYKQGDEIPAKGKSIGEAGTNPNRGVERSKAMKERGFAVIGEKDDLFFAEPGGSSFSLVNDRLKELVDEIHRIVNQMANSVSSFTKSQQRSGISKELDQRGKEKVLSAYGHFIKLQAIKIYDIISKSRKENIKWDAMGMSDFRVLNRSVLIQEGQTIQGLGIPSRIFLKSYLVKLANSLADDMDYELQSEVAKEIETILKNVTDEQLISKLFASIISQDKEFSKKDSKSE